MSSFRWEREFDNVTVEYFNSHLPPKSPASRVIYLVLQFINLIYDETELLDFTALALPAGKNLAATCGIYSERKQHYIESFPYTHENSQQVAENSKPNFRRRMPQREVCQPRCCSPVCPVLHVQQNHPGGAFGEAEKARSEDAAVGLGADGSRSSARGRRAAELPAPRCSHEAAGGSRGECGR